jgi:hypothetical protein
MKLTKKTFAPNLLVEVVKTSYNFANSTITEFKTYKLNLLADLNIKTDTTIITQPIGTKLITIKMINYSGSPRVIFKDNNGQMYQAFWIDFSKFVRTDFVDTETK